MLVAKEQRDFSKAWFDAVAYSSINFALFYWVITIIIDPIYRVNHPYLFPILTSVITIVAPAIWPCLIHKIVHIPCIAQRVIAPIRRPWDFVFAKREPYYVVVHLKDGRKICGKYGKDSHTSSYPMKEQIYLQETWGVNETTGLWTKVEGTKGILILGEEVLCLDLLEGADSNND